MCYLLICLLQASNAPLVKATSEQVIPWGVRRVHASAVWDQFGSKGEGIQAAVIDGGVDRTHPDLDDNIVGGASFVEGKNWWEDPDGHGTHCAGIITAEDNDIGVVGVAPKVSLYALKVDEVEEGTVHQLALAIHWCIDNNIQIVSMSLGADDDFRGELLEACNEAYDSGVLLVAASGGKPPGQWIYPAKYPSVIAVGAVDSRSLRWTDNPTGPELEIMAPGVDINSTDLGGSYSTHFGKVVRLLMWLE